jgi:hypothetical protein
MTADIYPYHDKSHQNRRAKMSDDHRIVFGVDWGNSHDTTVISVIDASAHRCLETHKFYPHRFQDNRSRIRILAEKFHPAVIIVETNSAGNINIEALKAEGLPVREYTITHLSQRYPDDADTL